MENNKVEVQEKQVKKNERGASLVEYALLAALIAVVCILAIRAVGQKVSTQFSVIQQNL